MAFAYHSARAAVAADREALRRIARMTLCVAFTAVGAQLAVRLPWTPVPVTMQTLFVVLAGLALGPRDAFAAMAAYVALGAAGLPVFAGFLAGPAVLLGPTGGYLLAFAPAAALAGSLASGRGRVGLLAGSVAGLALILCAGAAWLAFLLGLAPGAALSLGLLPFLAGEGIKAVLAVVVASRR